ncbi:MAG: DUF362 domain-containing protein [Anaerolineae bacterium]|jgi:uncharacterized protein (DUF362 family)/NAD-dependent dihydropyrimidine dehydrogenase PreA subunit
MRQVSIRRCQSYDRSEVERAVARALEDLGGFRAFVQPGETVLVKPNLLVASAPDKAVTTHPEVVRAVILGCQEAGAQVWVGDSPGVGSPARVAERCGIMDVCRETGASFTALTDARSVPFPDGRVAKSFMLAEPVVQADKVISVAKLKTHGLMVYTGAVKNLYGTLAGIEKARLHVSYQSPLVFGRMLVDLYLAVKPVLSVVDAIVGMEGSGPRTGNPREVGLVLAGADGLAVDLAAATVIGVAPERIPYLAAAAEMDPDALRPERLEVLGLSLKEAAVSGFRLPATMHTTGFPRWMENLARRWATARPVIIPDLCVACGVCRDSCPPGAITVEDSRAQIDESVCIRCYCCQEMCPQGAVELRHNPLSRLLPWR